MKIKVAIANRKNYGGIRKQKVNYLVYHYTANDGDSDEANARYFQNNIVNASAHLFIDDDSITQSVADNYVAWSVGGKKYSNCGSTGGGKFYGKCTNENSISIELCDSKRNEKFDFTENTLNQGVELGKILMEKYNIPIGNVIRHFDVTGKHCPAPFIEDKRAWETFKERLVEEVVEKGKVIVDGKEHEVNMIRKDGVTYIKTRDIGEVLGLRVSSKGKVPVLDMQ